jgi:hypothetical protein
LTTPIFSVVKERDGSIVLIVYPDQTRMNEAKHEVTITKQSAIRLATDLLAKCVD